MATTRSRFIRFPIIAGLVIFILYHAVYFHKLDEVKAGIIADQFNPIAFAENLWNNELPLVLDQAIDIDKLTDLLKTHPTEAFDNYSNALGIGNIRYFLVSGQGMITDITEYGVGLVTTNNNLHVRIATELIFGNAVRDASGLVDINDFSNTMDFNNISAGINSIIRTAVVPEFIALAEPGRLVTFTGAMELNRQHLHLDDPEVIPVSVIVHKHQIGQQTVE